MGSCDREDFIDTRVMFRRAGKLTKRFRLRRDLRHSEPTAHQAAAGRWRSSCGLHAAPYFVLGLMKIGVAPIRVMMDGLPDVTIGRSCSSALCRYENIIVSSAPLQTGHLSLPYGRYRRSAAEVPDQADRGEVHARCRDKPASTKRNRRRLG